MSKVLTQVRLVREAALQRYIAQAHVGLEHVLSRQLDPAVDHERVRGLIDEGNRQVLGIEVAHSIPSLRVIRVVEQLIEMHGKPKALRLDNGPELTAIAFTEWCANRGIEARFIQPGKPDQNAFIERFNKTYRDEVLDAYVFESIEQVREVTETWLREYNEERPHDSLGRVPLLTFMPRPTPVTSSQFC